MEEKTFGSPHSAIFTDITFSCFFFFFLISVYRFILSRSFSLQYSSLPSNCVAVSTLPFETLSSELPLYISSLGMALGIFQRLPLSQQLDWVSGCKALFFPCLPELTVSYEMQPLKLSADFFSFFSRVEGTHSNSCCGAKSLALVSHLTLEAVTCSYILGCKFPPLC